MVGTISGWPVVTERLGFRWASLVQFQEPALGLLTEYGEELPPVEEAFLPRAFSTATVPDTLGDMKAAVAAPAISLAAVAPAPGGASRSGEGAWNRCNR